MHPGGRPIEYTEEEINKIKAKIEKYIKETEIPIVAEFAYKNDIRRQTLYELPQLSDTIKKLIDKKEAQLENKGLFNEVNNTMAVFSLKQLGWTDNKQEKVIVELDTKSIVDEIKKSDTTTD